MNIRLIALHACLLVTLSVGAQTYLGISADFGNQVTYQPTKGATYFERSITISGSVNFFKQEAMKNEWAFRYGVVAGLLGYNVKVLLQGEPYPFLDYTNIFVTVPLTVGKRFRIANKTTTIFFGVGGTYYLNLFPGGVTGSVSVANGNGQYEELFSYQMLPADRELYPFAELSVQTELSNRVWVGLLYRHHFKGALEGTYNFNDGTNQSYGRMHVQQRALSVLCLIRLGNRA